MAQFPTGHLAVNHKNSPPKVEGDLDPGFSEKLEVDEDIEYVFLVTGIENV